MRRAIPLEVQLLGFAGAFQACERLVDRNFQIAAVLVHSQGHRFGAEVLREDLVAGRSSADLREIVG